MSQESEKSERKKKGGLYDRIVIASLDDWPVFSHLRIDWTCEDGRSLEELAGFRLTKFLSITDRKKDIAVPYKGKVKNIKMFVRLEQGFQKDRLDDLIKELNDEMKEVHDDYMEETYSMLCDDYWEKAMTEKNYGRRNENGEFNFDEYKGYKLRNKNVPKAKKEDIMTDDRATEEEREPRFQLRTLRSATNSRETTPAPPPIPPPSRLPLTRTASISSLSSSSGRVTPATSRPTSRAPTPPKPDVQQPQLETGTSFLEEEVTFLPEVAPAGKKDDPNRTFLGTDATSGTSGGSADEGDKAVLDKNIGQTTFFSPASTSGRGLFDVGPNQDVTFAAPMPPTAVSRAYDPNDTFALLDMNMAKIVGGSSAGPSVQNQILLDVSDGSQIITKQNLMDALNELYEKIKKDAAADKAEIIEKIDKGNEVMKKKFDNKFQHVLDVKKNVQDIHGRMANLKQQVAKSSPAKSFSGQIELRSKGRAILFRHLRFNYMGVCCDIFFACHFVQEQLSAYIFAHLRKIALGGMNYAVAKTCLMTFFTPLARAHLIFGKIKNSTKNLKFNKRPIPEGMHNMIENHLVPALEDVNKVAPGSEAAHIANIRRTCASTFSTDRNNMIMTAIIKTHTPREAAEAVADCDYQYYALNKHHHGKKVVVPSREVHIAKTLERAEFGKYESMPGNDAVDKAAIFETLTTTSSNEIHDPKEMLRQIIVAAHLFGQDYRSLSFDKLNCFPELMTVYGEVVDEITDINNLVKVYSADASAHLPEVVVASPMKTVKRSADSKQPVSKKAKRGRMSPSLMTDDEESCSSSDDFQPSPAPPTRKPPVLPPPAVQPVQPVAPPPTKVLKVLLPRTSIPDELLTGSSSSETEPSTSKQ